MALLQTNMVKNALNTTELKLAASANESLVVKGIYISPTEAVNYATVFVGTATRGYFRIGGPLGNHLFFPTKNYKNILDTLYEKKIFTGYPIHTGGKISIETTAQTNICVVYDRYGEKEISETLPNGENAKEYTYLAYGQPSTNITTSGKHKINVNNDPDELPMFPFEAEAPSSGESVVHGVCFSGRGRTLNPASNSAQTKYLRIMKAEKTLFDEDKDGYLAIGTISTSPDTFEIGGTSIGGENTAEHPEKVLLFDQSLLFKSNESLDTYWFVNIANSGVFLPEQLEVSYIITKKTV